MTEHLARGLSRTLFEEFLDPVLAEHHLVGTRRVYRRIEPDGDALVMEFQRSTSSTRNVYAFFVNVAVVPHPWLLWMRGDSTSVSDEPPDFPEGMISTRLTRPNSLWTLPRAEMLRILTSGRVPAGIDSGDHERWWIDSPQAVAEHGATLRGLLAEKIAEFAPLLDRDVLRERLRSGAPLPGDCPRDAALAVLLADEGAGAELDDVLNRLHDPGGAFADRVRRYAARVGNR